MSDNHHKKKCYTSKIESAANNDEEEPDFESEENLEAQGIPSSAIQDEEDEENTVD